jgi:hypothetical protein
LKIEIVLLFTEVNGKLHVHRLLEYMCRKREEKKRKKDFLKHP